MAEPEHLERTKLLRRLEFAIKRFHLFALTVRDCDDDTSCNPETVVDSNAAKFDKYKVTECCELVGPLAEGHNFNTKCLSRLKGGQYEDSEVQRSLAEQASHLAQQVKWRLEAEPSPAPQDSASPPATRALKPDRRIAGSILCCIDEDGSFISAELTTVGMESPKAVEFGYTMIDKAARRLFVKAAAAGGTFTRQDVLDVIEELEMRSSSLNKVRERVDYLICAAAGKTGKGRSKPKAFMVKKGSYVSKLKFTTIDENQRSEARNRKLSNEEFAQGR